MFRLLTVKYYTVSPNFIYKTVHLSSQELKGAALKTRKYTSRIWNTTLQCNCPFFFFSVFFFSHFCPFPLLPFCHFALLPFCPFLFLLFPFCHKVIKFIILHHCFKSNCKFAGCMDIAPIGGVALIMVCYKKGQP